MNLLIKKRPLSKIHRAEADDNLGAILEKSTSSHDPIFIYQNGDFVGITSPYYAIFKKRYPYTTKVIHASVMPPRLTKDTSIYEVAEHMLSTKTYTLPIYKNEAVDGVVTARDILEAISENSVLDEVDIDISPPITIRSSSKIKDAYAQMRKKNISRLIVVNDQEQLEGILSRRDLQEAFTTPSRKLRFGKHSSNARTWSFDEEKIKRGDYPVHEFYRTDVAKVEEGTSMSKALLEMLRKNVGSVIFVNENNEPTGIVSTHTFLKALSGLEPTQLEKVLLTDKHNILSDTERDQIIVTLNKLVTKIKKRNKVMQLEAIIDEEKNSAGRVKLFQVSLHIILDKGQNLNTKVNGSNLKLTLSQAAKKIESQLSNNSRD